MTTAASPGTLAAAWPELQADPARAAAYAAAVEGLDPAAVAAVSDALRREGRPLPKPGVLRVAVLARAPRAPAGPPPPLQPPPPPPPPPPGGGRTASGSRGRTVAMAVSGAAAIATLASNGNTWATTAAGEGIDGVEFGAGTLVGQAALASAAAALIGGVYLWRRRDGGFLLQAFMLLAVLMTVALAAAARALWQIWECPVTVAPAYWPGLAATAVGAGAAITGAALTWPRASGRARRGAVGLASVLVLAGAAVVVVAIATAGPPAAGTQGAAQAEYMRIMSDVSAGLARTERAQADAVRKRDLPAMLDSLEGQADFANRAHDELLGSSELNRPPYRRQTVALADAFARLAEVESDIAARRRLGLEPTDEDFDRLDAIPLEPADAALRRSLAAPAP